MTRWQEGCQSWHNNPGSGPHQRWEACQKIQNSPLCPWFRYNFLPGNLCLWSNVANNKATKQTRNKKQAAKSANMNKNNNRLMLHTGTTFCREISGVQYVYRYFKEFASISCASQFLLVIINCKRKSILRPTHSTILIFRLQPALPYHVTNHKTYDTINIFNA